MAYAGTSWSLVPSVCAAVHHRRRLRVWSTCEDAHPSIVVGRRGGVFTALTSSLLCPFDPHASPLDTPEL